MDCLAFSPVLADWRWKSSRFSGLSLLIKRGHLAPFFILKILMA